MTPPFIDDLLADSSFAARLIPGLSSQGSHDASRAVDLPRAAREVSGSPKQPGSAAGGGRARP